MIQLVLLPPGHPIIQKGLIFLASAYPGCPGK